jgi:hypothetical protein
LLESNLALIIKTKTNFVSERTLNHALKYVTYSTKINFMVPVLKQFFNTLLFDVLVPLLYLSERDISLFNEDPIEYIRKNQNFKISFLDNRQSTLDLIE